MSDLEFGPVELVVAAFSGDTPDAGVISAIADLIDAGTVRLIDLVHVTRTEQDSIELAEVSEVGIELGEIDLAAAGLTAHEDVVHLGAALAPGSSALILVVELLWAKKLASRVAEAGGAVVDSVRIPAPIVNAAMNSAVSA